MKTLYYNGAVLPMDAPRQEEALLIQDGTILGCGKLSDFSGVTGEIRKVDLQGATLLPAFVDGHSHITAVGDSISLVKLGGAKSIAQLGERIRTAAKGKRPGEWIFAFGYDPNFLKEQTHPTAAQLDSFAPDNPVLLTHASGHMGTVNSLGLKALGITEETPDPTGGKIGRLPGGNQPSGYLEEAAFALQRKKLPKSPGDPEENLRRAEELYLSKGITTVQDGLTGNAQWALLSRMARAHKLKTQIVCYVDEKNASPILEGNPGYATYQNHLRIGGYKLFLDGSPQGKTAWLTQPYLGQPGDNRGYPVYEDDEVLELFRKAQREGKQLHVHCNGDRAAAQMISCYKEAFLEVPEDHRPVMIHAQLLRPDQLPLLAELRIIPSFFVAHVYHWGDVHLKNLGEGRANSISPAASALKLGMPFAFHQDSPVIEPDMIETLWCAVNRRTREGALLGPQERIPIYEALRAVTYYGAYSICEEQSKGSLAPGKQADLVILNRNPLECPPEELRDIQVLETIQSGKSLWKR